MRTEKKIEITRKIKRKKRKTMEIEKNEIMNEYRKEKEKKIELKMEIQRKKKIQIERTIAVKKTLKRKITYSKSSLQLSSVNPWQ
jgi:hypothetical protein